MKDCKHNTMTATGDPVFPWKCAECGYIYGHDDIAAQLADLRAQRHELLAACEHIVDVVNKWEAAGHALNDLAAVRSIAQSAITRAEGRPQ